MAAPASPVTYRYWNRPYAELMVIQKSRGVVAGTVTDAHCRGNGTPRITTAGVRTYNYFGCRVRSSVGGWVAVTIRPTGARTFELKVY